MKIVNIAYLKYFIKNNETLYFYANLFRNWKKKNFRALIRGFSGPDIVLVQHPGKKYPEHTVYCIKKETGGLFCCVTETLGQLFYAESYHLLPVIDWSGVPFYQENEPVNGTRNVFEYYFMPVSDISYEETSECKNVVYSGGREYLMLFENNEDLAGYERRVEYVGKLGELYSKYFRLNQMTEIYINDNLSSILGERKTLGVHIRGTDFKKAFNMHPVYVDVKEYIQPAVGLMKKYGYEQIFLATDSLEAVKLFKKEFGSSLVYYKDVLRSDGNVGVHYLENERKNHHYLLGLEVLRDAYTLAACDSLLAGMSNVSLAAQYIKIADGSEHREVKILNHGINHNNRKVDSHIKSD